MGVWRICERRRQTSCRIGLTSENGGGNSTTGKKNNHRRTKTQKCSQASFSFLSQGLEIYSTVWWKIGTIGSEIYLLSLRGFMFSRGQRHKCPSCRLRFSLTAFVVSSACAKTCYCGSIVGIPRLCSPKGQCGGLRFSYSDPWEGWGRDIHSKLKSPFPKRNIYLSTHAFCIYVLRGLIN